MKNFISFIVGGNGMKANKNGWVRSENAANSKNSINLLRDDGNTSFTDVTADKEFLRQVKYVITLDSDTQLPRDAARKLIGIAAHPLNRPHFDEKLQRVTEGYGILQPRVSISLDEARRVPILRDIFRKYRH